MANAVLELQQGENPILPALRKHLRDTQKSIDNTLDAIQQGIITPSTKQRLNELESTKESLEISIVQEEMQRPLLTKEQVVFWISRFRNGDMNDERFRQRLIDVFVNAIYLYDDRAVLVFNYKDGSKTVSLEDINRSFEGFSGSDLGAGAPPTKQTCFIEREKTGLLLFIE